MKKLKIISLGLVLYILLSFSACLNTKYTVTFASQGGSEVSQITNLTVNSLITEPESPIKDGYSFVAWYKEKECVNEWNFTIDKITKSITLYAEWVTLDFIEEEFEDMMIDNNAAWSPVMSRVGLPIELGYQNAFVTFEYSADRGCIIALEQKAYSGQKLTVKINNIEWNTDKGPSMEDDYTIENAYIDIVLKIDSNIIGYAVISIDVVGRFPIDSYPAQLFPNGAPIYAAKLLHSALIPKIDGEYQSITEKQIKAAIRAIKEKNEKGDII